MSKNQQPVYVLVWLLYHLIPLFSCPCSSPDHVITSFPCLRFLPWTSHNKSYAIPRPFSPAPHKNSHTFKGSTHSQSVKLPGESLQLSDGDRSHSLSMGLTPCWDPLWENGSASSSGLLAFPQLLLHLWAPLRMWRRAFNHLTYHFQNVNVCTWDSCLDPPYGHY